MREEAAAEGQECCFDAVAQRVERTSTLFCRRLAPALEPVSLRSVLLHSALVTQEPRQTEVRIEFVLEDGLNVELDVRLARKPCVVTQDPQPESIAHEAPE